MGHIDLMQLETKTTCFDSLMESVYTPGQIICVDLTSAQNCLSSAAYAVCTALFNTNSNLWLSSAMRRNPYLLSILRFQFGVDIGIRSNECDFALMAGHEWKGCEGFRFGRNQNPEKSTTVILEVADIYTPGDYTISCSDSERSTSIGVLGLNDSFWDDVVENAKRAPYGLDFILTNNNRIVTITRNCSVNR